MKTPLGKIVYTANGYDVRQEIRVLASGSQPTGYFSIYAKKKKVLDPRSKYLEEVKSIADQLITVCWENGFKAKRNFNMSLLENGFTLFENGKKIDVFDSIDKCNTIVNVHLKEIKNGVILRKQSYPKYWK